KSTVSSVFSIRMKRHRVHAFGRASHRVDALARSHVPKFNGAVGPAGGQPFTVRRKRKGAYRARILFERLHLFAGGRIPEINHVIVARGGQQLAVGRKGQCVNTVTMGFNRLRGGLSPETLTCPPDLNFSFLGGTPRTDCKVLAVARKGHGAHRFRNASKFPQQLACGRQGETDFAVTAGSDDGAVWRESYRTDLLRHRRWLDLGDLGFVEGLQLTDVLIQLGALIDPELDARDFMRFQFTAHRHAW